MKNFFSLLVPVIFFAGTTLAQGPQVTITNGTLEGTMMPSGIHSFKGIPYAAPPVGDLRWKEPQPVTNWSGVFKADHFGHNPMENKVFGDMGFRSDSMSEDCLYLNVWTPANAVGKKLPVLVYFFGGGFVAGDGSEARYDGESMAQKGIVSLTINYRLGIFGFFSHPDLTAESPHHSSGDYGLLDQNAALKWVKANIAAFGGDPDHITIAGESAGSIAVSAQMASPLSRDLIAGAIGESGAMINPTLPAVPLADAEKNGVKFATAEGAASLAALRAIPAKQLLADGAKPGMPGGLPGLTETVDGYFLPKPIVEIFAAGEEAHVPLLVGWNSAEVPYQMIMGGTPPTLANYSGKLKELYGDKADEVAKLYPATTDGEVAKAATALSSARFITYSTWKWADLQTQTGGHPVYRYLFSRVRPAMLGGGTAGLAGGVIKSNAPAKPAPPAQGAPHASEIEYAMGNLASNKFYAWTPDDYKVSKTMEEYFANFIKTGDPNGKGLPKWEPNTKGSPVKYINIDVNTKLETETDRDRYLFLDQIYSK
jgi:para-nitrobenzyl esterase